MWPALLEIGLKLLGFLLDKSAADSELKKKFLDFIGALEERQLISVGLKLSYKEQLERLKNGK